MAISLYAMTQLLELSNYVDPSIMVSTRDAFFTTDYEFTSDDGLQIAYMITEYDDNQMPIEEA